MYKRILSNFLTLCMALLLVPGRAAASTTVASGTCGENVTWRLDANGRLAISGNGDMAEYATYSEVPWYHYMGNIVYATISPGVTTIAPYSFWRAENLSSIEIPEGVTRVGAVCFWSCTSLTEVKLPNSVQKIEYMAFSNCSNLVSIGSLSNVSEIEHHAFFDCSNLNTVDISSKVTTIKSYVFHGCHNLISVGDLSHVTQIQEHAFFNCTSLQKINSLANVIKIGGEAFSGCITLETVGVIHPEVSVGENAFYNCFKLAERDDLDSEAKIHDITSDWYTNNESRIGWINVGTYLQDTDSKNTETAKVVDTVCSGLDSDLAKAKVLYAWVVDNICYDEDKYLRPGILAWEITDADKLKFASVGGSSNALDYAREDLSVILQRGVCGDICWVYAVMLRLAGIPAFSQSCKINNVESHACVMAFIDGEWRYFDPTFDSNGKYVNKTYYFAPNQGYWNYFNMDLQKFSKRHFFDENIGALPNATPSSWAQPEVFQAQLASLVPFKLQSQYDGNITREEFCDLMIALVERKTGTNINEYLRAKGLVAKQIFADTDSTSVSAANALGIVNGISETKFGPSVSIMRQEAAVMLARTARLLGMNTGNNENFADNDQISSWAIADVAFISGLTDPSTGAKVMGSTENGAFSPGAPYSREQAIVSALRLFHCTA